MRGGRREGAGRKKGSLSVLNRKTAEIAAAEGITPLEVTLITMRALWDQANGRPVTLDTEKAKEAMVVADRAAPYCHPRIAAVEPKAPPPEDTDLLENPRETARRMAFLLAKGAAADEKALAKTAAKPKKKLPIAA